MDALLAARLVADLVCCSAALWAGCSVQQKVADWVVWMAALKAEQKVASWVDLLVVQLVQKSVASKGACSAETMAAWMGLSLAEQLVVH